MLQVTETAFDGAHLSIPQVVTLAERPYAAITASGPMARLPEFAPPLFPRLHEWMANKGIGTGEGFFRYLGFHGDGTVELEVATFADGPVSGDGPVVAGSLPAGRYAKATHAGPYDRLFDAFCMLEGWIKGRGLSVEEGDRGKGRFPAAQVEIYRISPADTPDPAGWRTDILVKLKD